MNYEKLLRDSTNGDFDKRVALIMDNDGGYWEGLTEDDSLNEMLESEAEKKYGLPNGYADIVNAVKAYGIVCDWC